MLLYLPSAVLAKCRISEATLIGAVEAVLQRLCSIVSMPQNHYYFRYSKTLRPPTAGVVMMATGSSSLKILASCTQRANSYVVYVMRLQEEIGIVLRSITKGGIGRKKPDKVTRRIQKIQRKKKRKRSQMKEMKSLSLVKE